MVENHRTAILAYNLTGMLRIVLPVTEPLLEIIGLFDLLTLLICKFLAQAKEIFSCQTVPDDQHICLTVET